MNTATIFIDEVLGRAQQGITEPFICRGDDGAIYFIKGKGAGRRSQICEWVSAQLATAFGLPIAEYALAEVAVELIEANVFPNISQLGSGIVFASRELPHPQELTAITRDLVPDLLASDVLVFDWWLHNEDRHLTERGGNPNLLWDMQNSELVVIDHNQAFDRHFNPCNFLKTHVFASRWNDIFSDHLQREHYANKLEAILPRLAGIRANIPDSWWYVDDGVPADVTWDEIETCLQRCRQEDFWNTP
ncbi:HipA family kinase [Janthinobacterium sp. TND4EL3]|uniref:HipA family kinase n=1 Tax=Janthinobacterium sp. TND4EL3 TaxID=1907311 RepID=UPI0009FB009B|nr:HipA family kinase [Janthinobacterium sp. TND4EL3]